MPTKGNPQIKCRVTPDVYDQILEEIEISADTRRAGPYTLSSFAETAIVEKLDKIRRGRGEKGRRPSVELRDVELQ